MRTYKQSGFTIIELMLFLAITGALTVGILVGSSSAIGRQRYRDSVTSFKGHVQEQYGQIANVVNSEVNNLVCTQSGNTVQLEDESQQPRGTSDCLLMGRFLLIEGTSITTYNLIGQPIPGASGGDDTTTLSSYALAIQAPETYDISWGARIVNPQSTDDSLASVLIVRSPLSGSILTYVQDGDYRVNIRDMLNDTNMEPKDFCVDSGAGPVVGKRLAVRINARAANQSAIEIPLDSLEESPVCD